ncbi:MAG: bifunctional nuclease family protein [Acidobacteria bacterium]|nr:bifunctional nuclease family protein [Acidobacteriota bacterium]TDI11227.1 MAG: bifunctional nuclease family protein [Acidobacteriota bacterium]
MEREFKIKGLIMDPLTNSPIVILQSVEKNTLLPIWVGIFEANAIALQIERIDTPRPLTHDLIKNILLQLDANVDKIVVTDLQGNTFYAVIHLRMNGDHITIDSRPSDAIALALRTDAPIYVTEEVINNSRNISLEKENLDPEDIKKWLEGLNPDDMGKYKM